MTEQPNPLTPRTADPLTPADRTPDASMETVATPIPTLPVAPPPVGDVAPRRSNRVRWGIAAAFVAVVAIGTAAVAMALTGAPSTATVLGYVPTDSVMYGELRLDLPGDQRREVGEFLSKFPGFADQAALDTKLDEVLDRLVSETTDGDQTFSADIKPWFDGEMAFAVGPLPPAGALDDPASAAGSIRALALLSIKDEALARAWFTDVMAESGATGAVETYNDTELTVFTDSAMPGVQAAFALIDGKVAVAGDVTSVKAAVDTNGAGGLAGTPDFEAAVGAADGDHLGFLFVDVRTLMERVTEWSSTLGVEVGAQPLGGSMMALIPDWMSFRLRIEGDAVAMDSAYPRAATTPGPDENQPATIAEHAPPSTVLLAAGPDLGETLRETIDAYRNDPMLKELVDGIDEGAGFLGGVDASVSWLGETGLVINQSGDTLEGGVIVIPKDRAAGERLLMSLRSFVTLGGAQAGMTVRDEDYNGTTITIVSLGDLRSLIGMAGALGGAPVPEGATGDLPEGPVEIAYAVAEDVIVIGSGPAFVEHVLDAGAGASLADDGRFNGLLDRVGKSNTGVVFVDIAAMRTKLEGFLEMASAEERAEYEESLKPFLTPFDAFIAATVREGDLDEQHSLITVK